MLLVTGITGHTGSYFLKELVKKNYRGRIRCIVRKNSNTSLIDESDLEIEKVIGDLNDLEFLKQAMSGVETVMHIYNIHHSPSIIEVAIEKNVKRVILVHTTGIFSKFKHASAEYKIIEKKIGEIVNNGRPNLSVTILRPTMIYGDLKDRNVSQFIKMIDKIRIMPVINNGRSLIQPVYASDLGTAYYKVLMNPIQTMNKQYNLSGEKQVEMIDFLKLISKQLNKKTFFIYVPLSLGVLIAKIIKLVTFNKINYIEKVQRMGEDRNYSHENAITDFGYNPIPLEEGVQIEVMKYMEKNE